MWHHSPTHVFLPGAFYMVTAGTLDKEHFFRSPERLMLLQNVLFESLDLERWDLQSWAVFSNHYHFIAHAPENATTLKSTIKRLHSKTAVEINGLDQTPGRQVWFQYWDTCLTYERSYLARLNYVNKKPVHHGLVPIAALYPYCSASWFEQQADRAFRRKVQSFSYDRIKIIDDF